MTQLTEEATFRRLRQEPFEQVRRKVVDYPEPYTAGCITAVLEAAGWSHSEYLKALDGYIGQFK